MTTQALTEIGRYVLGRAKYGDARGILLATVLFVVGLCVSVWSDTLPAVERNTRAQWDERKR
jgi:hypothetical protein